MARQTTVGTQDLAPLSRYEPVIGLEVHVQLLTASKMFCGCSADYAGAPPNTHVCPVCLGMPGVLPVINRRAVEFTIMTALALNCQIPEASKFDRKNYPYPDLMKGYQISQYDLPLSRNGWLEIDVDGQSHRIGIQRVHLEEDTAKLVHVTRDGEVYSLVDVNRSGVPLMEIVSAPDIRSPAQARAYLQKLRAILRTIGVSTADMEKGAMRCDANISVRPIGSSEFGTKAEVKNMNSFRAVERALRYEFERQVRVLEEGGRVVQETRGWVEDRGVTVSQRSKEYAHDYRYFPEPDLPPLFISREWVAELQARLPELPDARRERFIREYGLSPYDATQMSSSKEVADFFEATVRLYPDPKAVSNWVQSELFRLLKEEEKELEETPLRPEHLAELLSLVEKGTIGTTAAKQVFEETFRSGSAPSQIVKERGLEQIAGGAELAEAVDRAIRENPRAVGDFRAGKEAALKFLIGQVMRATRGRANPAAVEAMLRERLAQ